MYKKLKGYLFLENIIALSLIGIMASLVVSVFSTSVFNLKKSYKIDQMLNLAKREMCFIEYKIQNNNEENLSKIDDKNINGLNIKSSITKEKDLFNCYKVYINVSDNENKISIYNYVVRL